MDTQSEVRGQVLVLSVRRLANASISRAHQRAGCMRS